MKREQMKIDVQSIDAINKNWQSIIDKMEPFMKECEIVRDWGGIVMANMCLRHSWVSIDTVHYDKGYFKGMPEFEDRLEERDVLIFSAHLDNKPATDETADL